MKTMKITRRLMGFAAALMALTACSESEDMLSAFHSDPNAVRITAEVGKASADGFTRSNPLGATEADQKKFNTDDEISVMADGQEAVTYKLVGTEWQPQGGKFLKWESQTMNFTAYYPASYTGGPITQPTEYNSVADLAAADYMSYSGPQSNTNGNNLTLTMNRLMARVVVEVVGFNDQYAQNTTVNSISINGVKAYNHDGKYYALIVPCEAQTGKVFLSLEVGDNKAKETLTNIPTLEAGKSYTYQLTVGKNKVKVNGVTVADWTTTEVITGGKAELVPFVTFTAEEEQVFKMTAQDEYSISGLEYSVNYGEWTKVVAGAEVTFGGDKGNLRLRGENKNGTADVNRPGFAHIEFTNSYVNVACMGDIRTLLDWRNYKTVDTSKACFGALFAYCTVLTSAPDLPAMTLSPQCYGSMFYGCTALEKAPDLPATTLADECYVSMFHGCTALEKGPELPATTLAYGCYEGMFYGCTALEKAPDLPATELAESCYADMFIDCSKLSTVTMLATSDAITKHDSCLAEWLTNAGTGAQTRTLQLKDKAAYEALKNANNYLPTNWQIGSEGTTVLDEANTVVE